MPGIGQATHSKRRLTIGMLGAYKPEWTSLHDMTFPGFPWTGRPLYIFRGCRQADDGRAHSVLKTALVCVSVSSSTLAPVAAAAAATTITEVPVA